MAPHPFQPMTTKLLKKLTRVSQDSDSTIESPDLIAEVATLELNSTLESNPQRSETNLSNLRTNNRY